MTIPGFQSLMLSLLKLAGDRKEHSLREAIEALAAQYRLTEAERNELLPSGRQAAFDNRVGWARFYLGRAGLLQSPQRARFLITERGLAVLAEKPADINIAYLRRFPEFVEFQGASAKKAKEGKEPGPEEVETPEEAIEAAHQGIQEGLVRDLLAAVKGCSPAFFERLVIDLLVKMGYGGTRRDAGQAIGRSGDGGIDGIIKEDRLGLDVVYVQAKRWDGTVGRPEIQSFAGALQGQRARRGVFVTTSDFSQPALHFASTIDSKIVLIDGPALARLMVDYNIGVTLVAIYELKRVDSDYFAEE
jgi:restriction system protein